MPLYAATIFLSAFLLFQVQPLVAKAILPWFGGSPGVWNVCLLFFQGVLLAGYAYAHVLARRMPIRRQVAVHGGLLALVVAVLAGQALWLGAPAGVAAAFKPTDGAAPEARILLLLATSVGLPYFALSTTGPLLQSWWARARPGSVYRLYAVSNAGSLLGLLAYPFLLEPLLVLRSQQFVWSALFAFFAGGCLAAGWLALRGAARAPEEPAMAPAGEEGESPSPSRYALWIGLSATGSLLLLATTNQLCQEVAVVPFLWVVPLAVYLVTFILCFESDRWYRRGVFIPALVVVTLLACFALYLGTLLSLLGQVLIYAALLFVGLMVCHGELARARPASRHLTGFYLATSAGGALGGVFVNFAAPLIFRHYWELHAAIVACWVFALAALISDGRSMLYGPHRRLTRPALAAAFGLLLLPVLAHLGVPLEGTLALRRSFYGVVRVERFENRGYGLTHGRIVHGLQVTDGDLRREPTSYYGRSSGVGLAIENHPRRAAGPLRIGVIGLGIGTLASYGRAGDLLRFYEINPDVIRLARGDGGYFHYLSDTPATVEIVPGDARLSLERELREGHPQRFDVLVLDAFSSDAIPAHLLTREAFTSYLAHLAPDGLLLAHVSNRFLELGPVVSRLANELSLTAEQVLVEVPKDDTVASSSNWVVMARDPVLLQAPALAREARKIDAPGPLWTDAYAPLLTALRP